MGYNTDYDGVLYFKENTTLLELNYLKRFLGEDIREHPEWQPEGKGMTYIDLKVNDDLTGLIWDGSEKSYEMCEKINFIIIMMRKKFPNFELHGKFLCQGEDMFDRYFIKALGDRAEIIDIKEEIDAIVECPNCGHKFKT